MTRYFFAEEQRQGQDTVLLTGDDAHHLFNVLRATVGETVELCDEQGLCCRSSIITLDKRQALCQLMEPLPDHEPAVRFTLAFGLLKGDNTELVLQKATELGVSALLPLISERTVVRPEKKNTAAKMERWEKIVRSAAAQSRRNRIPVIMPPVDWPQLAARANHYDRAVFFWEGEHRQSLGGTLRGVGPGSNVLLVTGPEGGFSAPEAQLAVGHGMKVVTLGPRILRAETAALAALAVALYEAGEMGGNGWPL
jgi:16S rRNA (uracil1498-N3)-methyltransferase